MFLACDWVSAMSLYSVNSVSISIKMCTYVKKCTFTLFLKYQPQYVTLNTDNGQT